MKHATYTLKTHAVVLSLYVMLALVLTWPLVAHFTTHVPGDGSDDPALVWNLWWIKFALLDLGQSPIYCNWMFYPIGLNLAFYTLTLLNGFLALPIQLLFGLIPASNVVLLSSFVLSGYSAFLLTHHLLPKSQISNLKSQTSLLAAFIAGLIYAFSSNKMLYASLGQFNIASSQWIPFCVLFLIRMRERPDRWHYGFLMGLFLALAGLAEFTFASFLLIFAFFFIAYYFFTDRRSILNRGFVRNLTIAALVFIVALLPILYAMVNEVLVEGDYLQQGLGFADVFSADLLGFFVPSHLNPLLGSMVSHFDFAYTNFVFVGYITLVLAFFALARFFRDRIVRFWGLSLLAFIILSLGPTLRINGQEFGLPLPFTILLQLPFFKGNRYPSRFSVMITLCLAVLVGYGIAVLAPRLTHHASRIMHHVSRIRYHVSLLLALLILCEHLSIPLPLTDLSVPPFYRTISSEPGNFTVLEVPLAWRNGFRMYGLHDKVMMLEQFYQTEHQRPILGGNTSRNPELKFGYFIEAPVINSLTALETGHEVDSSTLAHDKAIAPEVLQFFGVRYMILHRPQANDAVQRYIEDTLPVDRVYEHDRLIAYRVNESSPPTSLVVNPRSDLARLNFAEGWGTRGEHIWAERAESRLLVNLAGGATVMTIRAFAPGPGQTLAIEVNGHRLAPIAMSEGWSEYRINLPAEAVHSGMNDLRLHFGVTYPVGSAYLGDYRIGTTGTTAPVSIVVRSAGMEVGDFGHIFVEGRDVSPNERGYNLAVIDPTTGVVEFTAHFDTFAAEIESQRLANLVAAIPPGHLVAVVVRDEASMHLTAEAIAALHAIGAQGDLQGRFCWSHAIIGVKGAAPGTAAEALSLTRPTEIVVGEGVVEPRLVAAIAWIRFETRR